MHALLFIRYSPTQTHEMYLQIVQVLTVIMKSRSPLHLSFSCHPSFSIPCSPNPCVSTLRDTALLHIIFSPTLCMLFLKIKMQFLLNVRTNNNVLYLKNATLIFFIFRTQQICNWYTITGVMLRNYVSQNPFAFFVIVSSLYNRSSSSLACIHLVDEFFM